MLRTLFFGTSAFALASLDVVADRTALAGVVTQPDRPAGRGQRLTPTPVKRTALDRGLRVYEPQNLRIFAGEVESLEFDAFVVASYGRILPAALLDLPSLGALNVHPSLLPRYRGATPINAALLAGDAETGVTIMLMDSGMDTGDIVLQERVAIEAAEDAGSLHDRLARLGARLLGDAIRLAERDGAFPRTPQEGEPSLTRPIRRDDLDVDWNWSAQRIVNHVRAYAPVPAARALVGAGQVKLLAAHVARDGEQGLRIECADGAVILDRLIAPNRAAESGAHYKTRTQAQ